MKQTRKHIQDAILVESSEKGHKKINLTSVKNLNGRDGEEPSLNGHRTA